MNLKEEIILGALEKVSKKRSFKEEELPSKVGGAPVLLDQGPDKPLLCSGCGSGLKFLMQLYAPLGSEQAFHRSIYLFFCPVAFLFE